MPKASVLVVEDESIVSKDIQYSLKKLGYEVVGSASTGAKAVELALDLKPNVILMDIMLKGDMSGIEASAKNKGSVEYTSHIFDCLCRRKNTGKSKSNRTLRIHY